MSDDAIKTLTDVVVKGFSDINERLIAHEEQQGVAIDLIRTEVQHQGTSIALIAQEVRSLCASNAKRDKRVSDLTRAVTGHELSARTAWKVLGVIATSAATGAALVASLMQLWR